MLVLHTKRRTPFVVPETGSGGANAHGYSQSRALQITVRTRSIVPEIGSEDANMYIQLLAQSCCSQCLVLQTTLRTPFRVPTLHSNNANTHAQLPVQRCNSQLITRHIKLRTTFMPSTHYLPLANTRQTRVEFGCPVGSDLLVRQRTRQYTRSMNIDQLRTAMGTVVFLKEKLRAPSPIEKSLIQCYDLRVSTYSFARMEVCSRA